MFTINYARLVDCCAFGFAAVAAVARPLRDVMGSSLNIQTHIFVCCVRVCVLCYGFFIIFTRVSTFNLHSSDIHIHDKRWLHARARARQRSISLCDDACPFRHARVSMKRARAHTPRIHETRDCMRAYVCLCACAGASVGAVEC